MKKFAAWHFGLILMTLPGFAVGRDVYVSPSGNDANPGTISRPLATFAVARDMIFRYKSAGGPIRIDSIDLKKKPIRLANPHLYGIASGEPFQRNLARNIRDEPDSPGEYYLDRRMGILYYRPPSDCGQESTSPKISRVLSPCLSAGSGFIPTNSENQ